MPQKYRAAETNIHGFPIRKEPGSNLGLMSIILIDVSHIFSSVLSKYATALLSHFIS
jgi:hypothetical protein